MQRLLTFLITIALSIASYVARAGGDQKAADLLAKARAAIGGEKVAKVQGLSCTGTLQRAIGDRQVAGDVTLELQLPDKMLRTDSISPMGDSTLVVTEQGVSGDVMLRHSRILNAPPGAMIRTPPPPAPGSEAEAQAVRNSRAELARFTVAMLLAPPSTVPLEFVYAGEAESPDGKADVIDVKGAGGFAAKLFLDLSTHRPLMLAYRGVAPRMVVQTQQGPPPAGRGNEGQADPAASPAPEAVDINLFLDDYRPVDGVLLPHHVTRSVGGQTSEELTFKTIKVNPSFKAETFGKR